MTSLLAVYAALALSGTGLAVAKGDLTLEHPQVRASIGATTSTAAYLTVRNGGDLPDRLLSASCTCAARVEIHTHQMQGGVARMRRVPALAVPARGRAVLAPGGAHLMLIGLKQPVREGADPRLTLVFERAGAVTVRFHATRRIETAAAGGHAH